MKNLNAVKAT